MDLSNKTALIIDCFPEYRNSIKNTLSQMGSKLVHTVTSADRAIEKVEEYDYDIIISEYMLGDGKNGQELIEELRHKLLLKPTTIVGIVSAENTGWVVLGVIEQRPDFYLKKPFKNISLVDRIEHSFKKKSQLYAIEQALLNKDYEKAIKYCDINLLKKTKYPIETLRLRSEALLGWGKNEEAVSLYGKMLVNAGNDDLSWIQTGLGKACFGLKNYADAISNFNLAIGADLVHTDAFDWLAKSYLSQSNPVQAQNALELGVKSSPKNVRRLQELSDLAIQNRDTEVAIRTLRKSVKEGKHSCFKRVDDSLNLASLEFEKNPIASFQLLNSSAKEFRADAVSRLRIEIKKSALLLRARKRDDGIKSLKRAESMCDAITENTSLAWLEFSEVYLAFDFLTEANEGINKVVVKDLDGFLKKRYHQLVQQLKKLPKISYHTLNEIGIDLFKEGNFKDAFEKFETAAKGKPKEVSYSLNAVQALLMSIKGGKIAKEKIVEASFFIKNCQDLIDRNNDNYSRLMELIKIHKSLS